MRAAPMGPVVEVGAQLRTQSETLVLVLTARVAMQSS